MTVAELKKQAKAAKIKNWWLMTKAELEACLNVNAEETRIISPGEKVFNNIMSHAPVNVVAAVIPSSQVVAATVTLVDPQGEHESVEDFIARGGKITVIPTPLFPAPKPTRESSAMKSDPATTKRTPRKVAKPVVEAKPERKRPTTTKPNKGTQVAETLSQRGLTSEKRVPVKTVKAKPVSSDVVTLASLTEGRDIEGRILRRMLRNSDIEKPGAQWEWPKGHADISKVEAIINKRWI